ncbi:MAG: FkbM family methyltransferase [Bacteroidota bacterium]|nr:FkbM family methyltransferase [Flavisolibacter sp.]MBD0367606.1 FkbM family methyltransferase [Flavisolibacter sp.]MBD0376326.1 FkbM family methyltransferase [Flavisolibacter sp.]MDQ3843567.1 FkbM family methyltransferase [Bacteroidota bacterium]
MQPFSSLSGIASLTRYEFETACRNNIAYAYLGANTALCRILTRYKIYLDVRDLGITPHLIMDGFWESWITQRLARIVKPGYVCFDIGANFGYFSILMSELAGRQGRTIAVEPNANICKLLHSTAAIHSQPFEVAEVALSNTSGKAVLIIPEEHYGDASIIQRRDRLFDRKKKMKVKAMTLDELAKQLNLTRIDVIKMDVEGVEPLVFEGMQKTIAANPDLRIIFEYSPFMYADARQFTEYLFSNFVVHRLKDVDEMTTLDESSIADLLLLKDHTDLYLQRKPF